MEIYKIRVDAMSMQSQEHLDRISTIHICAHNFEMAIKEFYRLGRTEPLLSVDRIALDVEVDIASVKGLAKYQEYKEVE